MKCSGLGPSASTLVLHIVFCSVRHIHPQTNTPSLLPHRCSQEMKKYMGRRVLSLPVVSRDMRGGEPQEFPKPGNVQFRKSPEEVTYEYEPPYTYTSPRPYTTQCGAVTVVVTRTQSSVTAFVTWAVFGASEITKSKRKESPSWKVRLNSGARLQRL